MRSKHPIAINYRFKKYPLVSQGHFERFAQTAQHLVHNLPLAIPNLPFGSTSRVSSGVLESGFDWSPTQEAVRLVAIESSDGTLLEHSYDPTGRLLKTMYADGVCLKYRWNDANQLTTVHLPEGHDISYKYREDGPLETVTYPGGLQFRYEYSSDGKLLNRVYPDRKHVTHIHDRQGQLVEVLFINSGFAYEWDDCGSLRKVLFRSRGEIHEFALRSDRLNIYLTPCYDDSAAESEFMSSLGVWVYSPEGQLREMMLPDGERLCIHAKDSGFGDASWNSLGQTVYQYDKDRVLSAVLHPNGMRTVYHRIPKTNDVYLVSANGVALYQYDYSGKLLKIRDDNGRYAVFSYDRNGLVTKVTTASGWIKLRHDDIGRLRRMGFSSGLSAKFLYGPASYPTSVSLRGMAPDAFVAALTFVSKMWQWTALKPALRLEDQVLREV